MKDLSAPTLRYRDSDTDLSPDDWDFAFEPGTWYATLDPDDWLDRGFGPSITPMLCVRVHPSGRGMMVTGSNNRSEVQWWAPTWDVIRVESPQEKEKEMTAFGDWSAARAAALEESRQRINREADMAAEIAGLGFQTDLDDGLDNSSDDWIVDEATKAICSLKEKLELTEQNTEILQHLVKSQTKQVQALQEALEEETRRRQVLEGRVEAAEDRPVYAQAPFLWDRVTGDGPLIEVPMKDEEALARGQIRVYSGDGGYVGQTGEVAWRETLTTVPPEDWYDDNESPSALGRIATGLCLAAGASMAALGGYTIVMALFPA